MLKEKKGIQLSQAFGAVLTLVLVAVLVIIAIFIFVSLGTSFAGNTSVSIVNETLTTVDETGELVAGSTNCSFGDFSVSLVTNATVGTVIETANWSSTAEGLVLHVGGDTDNNGSDWNVSYSYTWGSEACTASDNMSTEFGAYTSLVGLVGTIIFLGLVIGILVAAFAFGGRREV